jgi:predicted phage terminase large subunit-like protein
MGATEDGFYWVLGVVRGQWSSHNRNQVMRQTAMIDGVAASIGVEREPAAGKESAEISVRLLAGFSVTIDEPKGNKEVRAQPFAAQCEAGNVFLLAGDWNEAYIEEHCRFPKSSIKDQVDASSGAFNYLVLHNTWGTFGGSSPSDDEFRHMPGGEPTLERLERGWGGDDASRNNWGGAFSGGE